MNKKLVIVTAAALALSACGRSPFPVLETQLESLKGQPARVVIDRLGSPDEILDEGGGKAYVWSSNNGGLAGGGAIGLNCTVKIFADKKDRIVRYDFDGDTGGCAHYAHRLDKSYDFFHAKPIPGKTPAAKPATPADGAKPADAKPADSAPASTPNP